MGSAIHLGLETATLRSQTQDVLLENKGEMDEAVQKISSEIKDHELKLSEHTSTAQASVEPNKLQTAKAAEMELRFQKITAEIDAAFRRIDEELISVFQEIVSRTEATPHNTEMQVKNLLESTAAGGSGGGGGFHAGAR